MGILFLLLLVLAICIVLFLCMAIDIQGTLLLEKSHLSGNLNVRAFGGLFSHTFVLPAGWNWHKRKKKKTRKHAWKRYRALFYRILRALNVFTFRMQVRLGTDDAAQTALLCGGITAFLQAVFQGVLPRGKAGAGWQGIAIPVFDKPCLDIQIACIISFRLLNIIGAAICWQVQSLKERT